jgi:hypothetical protein
MASETRYNDNYRAVPVLLFAPRRFVDIWVKMVVPPLPALLADATGQLLRDL